MPFSFFKNAPQAPEPTTVRVVLTEPFVRLAAGYVFELFAATGVSGWADDERLRERLSFSDKRVYHLPDGGNGAPAELPFDLTRPCPEGIFDGVDLRSGPCRVTGSSHGNTLAEARPDDWKCQINLLEIKGLQAQGLAFPLDLPPRSVVLHDLLHDQALGDLHGTELNLGHLQPGFYRLEVVLADGTRRWLRVLKAFPLLVNFSGKSGTFTTQKTLY
jgi:hypothetical protein